MSEPSPKAPDERVFKVSMSFLGIGLGCLIILIGILVASSYFFSWGIEFKDYLGVASFGCVTIGLFYNAISLRYNYELNKLKLNKEEKENHGKKIKITYEAISDWYKSDMSSSAEVAKRFIKPYKGKLGKMANLTAFKKELSNPKNINNRRSLIAVLNYFEHLSLLIEDGVIDEATLRKAFRTAFITLYANLKEYIEDEQRGNSGANAKIYINFVGIAKKWLHS